MVMNDKFTKFLLFTSLLLFSSLITYFLYECVDTSHLPLPLQRIINKKKPDRKVILIYTSFFGDKPWVMAPPMRNYSKRCGCNVHGECEITYDQNKLKTSDMVIFHGRDMPDLRPIHKKRPRDQLWTYFTLENPFNAPNVASIDQYFDLTSSYRLNSDIHYPYRYHRKRDNQNVVMSQHNFAKGKTKQIAWAVSNCGHRRELLAKKLSKYGLKIDNFGRCSLPYVNKRSIPRGKPLPIKDYKFYFAAENRLCNDYITEKYWGKGFSDNANAIPIVLGGANYSDPNLAIPGSFIDALTFSSPKKLAEYLLLVDKNDTLFNEYFKWKANWVLDDIPRASGCDRFVCDICEKIYTKSWHSRKYHSITTINSRTECGPKERFFDGWIRNFL